HSESRQIKALLPERSERPEEQAKKKKPFHDAEKRGRQKSAPWFPTPNHLRIDLTMRKMTKNETMPITSVATASKAASAWPRMVVGSACAKAVSPVTRKARATAKKPAQRTQFFRINFIVPFYSRPARQQARPHAG